MGLSFFAIFTLLTLTMSFYIVPTMLYQQQQKAKNKKAKKSFSRRSSKSSGSIMLDMISRETWTSKSQSSAESDDFSFTKRINSLSIFQSNVSQKDFSRVPDNLTPGQKEQYTATSLKDNYQTLPLKSDLKATSSASLKVNSITENNHDSVSSGCKINDIRFQVFDLLEILNSQSSMKNAFYRADYAMQRFSVFLDWLSELQVNDPINFAGIRVHSLYKFVGRLHKSQLTNDDSNQKPTKWDIHHLEGSIAFELFKLRHFIRKMAASDPQKKVVLTEELMQINMINYSRFILNLPNLPREKIEGLDEIYKQHYKFKNFFGDMALKISSTRKDGYLDEVTTGVLDDDYLMQTIEKVSYEFTLLEKYFMHILFKLNKEFPIENRVTKHLYSLYKLNLKFEKKESLKVLVFNSCFSRQYSWYLSATLPFLRVIESSKIYSGELLQLEALDGDANPEITRSEKQEDFRKADIGLWEGFFKRLTLGTFENFKGMSKKDLVTIQKEAGDTKLAELSLNKPTAIKIKPVNFEYYSKSLTTIASETFHVIQSRDLNFQLNKRNLKPFIQEFHRILKPGGILELPIILSGEEEKEKSPQGVKTSFPNASTFMDIEIREKLDLIPHFFEELLRVLSEVFEPKKIKFSSVILSSHNDLTAYLINYTAFSLCERFGLIEKLHEQFERLKNQEQLEKIPCHYYFYVQVEK